MENQNMETQLTTSEINEKQQLLQDYNPAQEALAILEKTTANLTLLLMNFGIKKYPTRKKSIRP